MEYLKCFGVFRFLLSRRGRWSFTSLSSYLSAIKLHKQFLWTASICPLSFFEDFVLLMFGIFISFKTNERSKILHTNMRLLWGDAPWVIVLGRTMWSHCGRRFTEIIPLVFLDRYREVAELYWNPKGWPGKKTCTLNNCVNAKTCRWLSVNALQRSSKWPEKKKVNGKFWEWWELNAIECREREIQNEAGERLFYRWGGGVSTTPLVCLTRIVRT